MQIVHHYISTAEKIISQYSGDIPLHHFLKQFFAADKKYGSRDRKQITEACYCYYRLGKAAKEMSVTDALKTAIFLCNEMPGRWSDLYDDAVLQQWSTDVTERISLMADKVQIPDIFPCIEHVSAAIEKDAFVRSHLIQPDLFLRIRPGKKNLVISALENAAVPFHIEGDDCLVLANGCKVDTLLSLNSDAVVQDRSSQKVAEVLREIPGNKNGMQVWDCCAASGGKSILAYDTLPGIFLTVSDVRSSILHNLQKRFETAGIRQYQSFVQDLTTVASRKSAYDLVICDAPCSGSGTWGRTPEQLSFFTSDKIHHYQQLQQRIVTNAIPSVKKNGFFLYITCSVFQLENEAIISFIHSKGMQLQTMRYFTGYAAKADTMFAALFTA